MSLILQILAGGFSFIAKIFFSRSERASRRAKKNVDARENEKSRARRWLIAAWVSSIAAWPAWVIILAVESDWIAAGNETSGAPAMFLGLITTIRGSKKQPPRWLDYLALTCVILGLSYSLYDFGGLTALSQYLELGLVGGYLLGNYQLAKKRPSGYLWYVLMHASTAWLMYIQDLNIIFLLQIVSIAFVADAYRTHMQAKKENMTTDPA